jgi:hypothetical protein
VGIINVGISWIILLKKIMATCDKFRKAFKYTFYFIILGIMFILPYSMTTMWKPYVIHCETKLDRTDAVPSWCFDEWPNIFPYI